MVESVRGGWEVGGQGAGCIVQGARNKVQPSTWVVESVRLSGGKLVGSSACACACGSRKHQPGWLECLWRWVGGW